ncbi:hypothetical protein Hokovirus_1_165 [Hokovirus HKV1]|uniref:Uncharacterized protein n=1 Tax=Hokovirus HKV1 TaxID=1977638 RepID=A0A1V0SEZ3_9VIRU|nr:hypothetical protein Hokovirus_1_165 [Hokovirus HKV1]
MFCYESFGNYFLIIIIIICAIVINYRILQILYSIGYLYFSNFSIVPYPMQEMFFAISCFASLFICCIIISLFISLSSLCLSSSGKMVLLILLFIELFVISALSVFISMMLLNLDTK